ncbi:MAG TPA: DUF1579 family protein [Thermoanaerobaculia bacterium]
MKRQLVPLVLIIVAFPLAAQEKKTAADDVMQAYIEAAKPVVQHERLRSLSGKWNMTMRFWMDPSQPPMTMNGTAIAKSVLGGRFLQLEGVTEAPLPSESITMMGFDRRTNEYTLVGFDTLGTYYITAAGKEDAAAKAIVLRGTYKQPPSMKEQSYRFVWSSPSADEHLLRLFFALPDGKDMLVAETQYTRAR